MMNNSETPKSDPKCTWCHGYFLVRLEDKDGLEWTARCPQCPTHHLSETIPKLANWLTKKYGLRVKR